MDLLLNWLLQGTLIALAAALGLRLVLMSSAPARYGFIWAAYLLVLALPVLPRLWPPAIDVPVVEIAAIQPGPVLTVPTAWWTSVSMVMGLWILWSCVHAAKLVAAAVRLHQARRRSRPCPPDVLSRLPCWSRVIHTGRRARVVLSHDVRFAAVLSGGSPVIALAPALLAQLTADDLDRVLVHEWAHVQRRDDVVQFVQRIVGALVGWHPAAWWLERQLEFEREAACDEVAVKVTGSAKQYAACLATLAALPHRPVRPLPALAAVSSGLRRRLERILALASLGGAARPRRFAAVTAVAGLAALALTVANVRTVASAGTWPLPLAPPPPAVRVAAVSVSTTSASVVEGQTLVRTTAPSASPINQPGPPSSPATDSAPDNNQAEPIAALTTSPTIVTASGLLHSLAWTARDPVASPIATSLPVIDLKAASLVGNRAQPVGADAAPPWTLAANAGIAIGRSSQTAGLATAGFFSRFGKRIARSF